MQKLSKIFGKLKGPPDFWKMSDSKRRDTAVALLMAGEIDRFNEGVRLACGLNLAATALFRIDLRSLDFSGENLAGANLSCAILDGSTFKGANLAGTNLIGVRLTGDFANADLREAELGFADLGMARNLTAEQLSVARLTRSTVLPEHISPKLIDRVRPKLPPKPPNGPSM